MRTALLLLMVVATIASAAQPGIPERVINPCGMPPPDSVDVSADQIPDLLIDGYTIGTDDEPSSTGSCTRFVGALPGTFLLCALEKNGGRVPHPFAVGDTIAPLSTKIENDLLIPRLAFTEGRIIVAQWGYGNAWRPPEMIHELEEQAFVFSTVVNDQKVWGSFMIEFDPARRFVHLKPGRSVGSDEPLIIR